MAQCLNRDVAVEGAQTMTADEVKAPNSTGQTSDRAPTTLSYI